MKAINVVLISAALTLAMITSFSSHAYGTAFLKYERTSGMNKHCYYEFLGNGYYITIKNYKLCPLSIKV